MYENRPLYCEKCSYPFEATSQEQSKFIAKQILKKSQISSAKDGLIGTRVILWLIGAFHLFVYVLAYNSSASLFLDLFYLVWGIVFIACGFLVYKKPLIAIAIPCSLMFAYYLFLAIFDPEYLWNGITWKAALLGALTYSLINVVIARRNQKEFSLNS